MCVGGFSLLWREVPENRLGIVKVVVKSQLFKGRVWLSGITGESFPGKTPFELCKKSGKGS